MRSQLGTSLIEVLVTVLILSFGLLGLSGLQARLQLSDMEAYQRAQALALLDDMASRINSNRARAADYVTGTGSPLGANMACPTSVGSRQKVDTSQWCHALQGAAEAKGGNNVGTMVGARGCVEALPDNEYFITVAWQSLGPISAPPESVACGAGKYDGGADSACTADLCRRAITTVVRIGTLN